MANKGRARVMKRWIGDSLRYQFTHWKQVLRQAKELRATFARREAFLADLFIFADWPESLLNNLARRCKERTIKAGEVLASVSSLVRHVSFVQAGEIKLVVPKDAKSNMMEMQLAMRGAGDIVGAFALSSLTDQNVAAAKWKYNVVAASSEAQHPFPFHPSQQEPNPFQHLMSCRAASSRRSHPVWCQVRLLEMTLRDFKDYVALSHRGSTRKALAGMVTLEEELWKRYHAQREAPP